MLNELMWNVIVRFVYIDGRADRYNSNVLFIFSHYSHDEFVLYIKLYRNNMKFNIKPIATGTNIHNTSTYKQMLS